MQHWHRPARFVPIVLVLLLAGAACSDDGPGDAEATPTSSTTTTVARGDCSAGTLDPTPVAQPELPDAVAETRTRLAALAVACDYDGLAALAGGEDGQFTASFGGTEDPADFWRELEANGEEPLRFLRELLDRPFARDASSDDAGPALYVWPSAFIAEWEEVPEADREALRPLFDDDDFTGFVEFGGYIGYRVGITETGDWRYFVAGD